MKHLWKLTAAEASAALVEKSITSEALVRACLERIAEREPVVKAWAFVDPDMAIRSARELDKQKRRSALHGIPVGIKDMIDTADMPTQHNSPIYTGHRPGQDAACVSILRSAGAVILGKTDTHEFAAGGRLAATRNPHDLTRTAGGSSTGSGAAVGDHQVPLALGTQTAGSTIRPGSFNGVFAIKPTFGTLNREGAKVYSISLDTIGWFGRSVADLGLLADVFNIDRAPWQARASVKGMKIALCRTPYWKKASKESKQAVEHAAEKLAKAGAKVTDLDLPKDFAALNDLQGVLMRGEGRAAFLAEYRRAYDLLHQDFRDRVEDKDKITPAEFAAAYDEIARLRPVFDKLAAPFDALLTPSAVGEAPADLTITGDPMFNRAWSALYAPCITIPAATGPNGMPVGVQLVGPRYADAKLLGVAAAVAASLGVGRV